MSEIFSKSIHMSGAGAAPSKAVKTEANGDDLLFAALFGGATSDISADDDNVDPAAISGVFAKQTTEKDETETPPQQALLGTIAALQAANGFDKKQISKANDEGMENNDARSIDENSDALAGMVAAVPLEPHINPAKGAVTNPLQNTKSIRVNMAFEDGKSYGQATANLPKIGVSPIQGLMQSLTAQAAPAGELAATSQAAASKTFIGPMPALSADAKMASNVANLRAIRDANREQRNAEINAKLSGDDDVDFNGRSDKAITTAASLKQALVAGSPLAKGDNMLVRASTGLDMTRPSQALSASVDSLSGTHGQTLNNQAGGQSGGQAGGQSGGQAGGQSGGQAGAATGGNLLNNLTMLQTLDMAKNNWAEMLLQRVQKGLAGGKDQLDFQLNPRNLGKMQITLVIQNDRTNIQIQTETTAAASMLNDSEARLSQMLEASGLRLGNLNSGQSLGFGGNMSGGHANQQNQAKTSSKADADDVNSASAITERSENLINIQA
ncbi:flagellar hook-length control protein FliK [Candidatus Ponderosibacter sp. Uisw_141_02]|uniref:flagellar hook-length control protein FliK n=1 Tax=Candidatus Ponderosibacter sp. Uisw_141_02 TaxID=3231000 RepID=UPI003D42A793